MSEMELLNCIPLHVTPPGYQRCLYKYREKLIGFEV